MPQLDASRSVWSTRLAIFRLNAERHMESPHQAHFHLTHRRMTSQEIIQDPATMPKAAYDPVLSETNDLNKLAAYNEDLL